MDKGIVVEIGKPVDLLDDTNGFLHHMVKAMGSEAANALRQKAIDAANEKKMDDSNQNINGDVEGEENDGAITTEVKINVL